MAIVCKNPNLSDYFVDHSELTSVVDQYEAGAVLVLPCLKPQIDHAFWASLDVDTYKALKKTSADANPAVLAGSLVRAGVPDSLAADIQRHASDLLDQILPSYERLFEGYVFTRRKVAWRLTTTLNENMHLDVYKDPQEPHFARLFVNLDTQPRIWQTSYTIDELQHLFGAEALRLAGPNANGNDIQAALNAVAFGANSTVWWDSQPRHVIYFEPGDCWSVDSRQVAHQIFYGRRALSIDFLVEQKSMRDPSRHYMRLNETWARKQLVGSA